MSDTRPDSSPASTAARALGVPEILFATGVCVALVQYSLSGNVALKAAQDLQIGPALVYLFAPIVLALMLLKVKPLARLGLGYFAGIAVWVLISAVLWFVRGSGT